MKYDRISIIGVRNLNLKAFAQLSQILFDTIDALNSTFTFHIASILFNILVFKIFAIYQILFDFSSDSTKKMFVLLINGSWLGMQCILQAMISHGGSLVTKNARKISVTVSTILNNFELSNELATKLQNFLARIQCRNHEVQNVFFTINWKLSVAVIINFDASFFWNFKFNFYRHRQRLLLIWSSHFSSMLLRIQIKM